MIARIDYHGFALIDAHNPTPDEVLKLSKELDIHASVSEDLKRSTIRPRVDSFSSHLYLVLHLPLFDEKNRAHRSREVDIVVGKNYLLTVHFDPIEPVTEFFNDCELDLALRERLFSAGGAEVLHRMWRRFYLSLFAELDHIQRKIDRIEERVFNGHEKELIEDISLLRRDILDFSRSLRPHETILDSLKKAGPKFFGEDFLKHLEDLDGIYRRIMVLLENDKDTLEALYDTNDSLITHRSNEIVKTLTMLALLTFPLTLIAAVFAIDAKARPIVGRANDFWIIVGIMFITVGGMLAFFKYRRWL